MPGSISHVYIDLGRLMAPVMLARLVRQRNVDVFCLKDTDSAVGDLPEQAAMVRDFMRTYFPFQVPWELAGRDGGTKPGRPAAGASSSSPATAVPRP